MSGQAVEFAATAQLLDGRLVSLRCLTPDDAKAALALHQHLSDHDRYFRFFTLNQVGLDQLVSEMTEPARRQCALGAFDANQLIGVANYVVSDDPTAADVGIVVAHEDHMRGVGTALLRHLAQIAETHGIRRFVADILAENHLMLKVFADLGWPCNRLTYGSIIHLEMELPECRTEAVNCRD